MELVLVVAAAIIAALVVTTALAVPRERRRAKSVFGASGLDLDAYELAFLAGGPARAVNTALASLAVREQVRVARGGRVTAIADAPTTSADPVEQAVLDLVTRPGGASAAEIRRRAGDGSAVAELRRRLIAQGHLLPDGFLEGARRLNARLRALAVLALAAAAVTLVLIVFTGTLASDAASWAAFAIAAISGGCALIASVTYAASLRDQLSHAGEEALRQARERQPRGRARARNRRRARRRGARRISPRSRRSPCTAWASSAIRTSRARSRRRTPSPAAPSTAATGPRAEAPPSRATAAAATAGERAAVRAGAAPTRAAAEAAVAAVAAAAGAAVAEGRFGRWLPSGRRGREHKRHAAGAAQGAASGGGQGAGLGVGIGWRPEIDLTVERLPGVGFVEVIAENVDPARPPESLSVLRAAGVPVVPHGVGLGVGGAHRPDPVRLARLAACAEALGAPLVSEHVAFVRAGAVEAGHLLPVPRTREALSVIVENVREAQDALPVPLALENVAALFGWPDDELTEAQFLGELVERTGVKLLVDVANLYTNQVNLGLDARRALDALPLEAVAYVHVAGGHAHDGLWHDTHTSSPPAEVLDLLTELCARVTPPGVLLEWDDAYPGDSALAGELGRIREAMSRA